MSYPSPGGSCLLSCRIDDKDASGNLVPHGYVKEFHIYKDLIKLQLAQMYANGQRRLGVPVVYFEQGDTLALDSSRGTIYGQDKQNLIDLLNTAVDHGFVEFVCEMVPEWSAAWNLWVNPVVMGTGVRPWQPVEYARNFIFTTSVWELFQALPAATHLDPLAEGIPVAGQDILLEYCQRLVGDLDAQYHDPMISISIIPTLDRIASIRKVYGDKLPYYWNTHFYPSAAEDWPTFKSAMNAAGLGGRGYVWGETYFGQALPADTSDLFFMLGWPVGTDTPQGISQDRLTI